MKDAARVHRRIRSGVALVGVISLFVVLGPLASVAGAQQPVAPGAPAPPTTSAPGSRIGAAPVAPASLSLLKRPVAGPPAGYAYEATGLTGSSFRTVTVTDTACASVAPIGGDTNLDGLLSPGETWTFRCSTDAPSAATSQATATASESVTGAPVTAAATVPERRMSLLVVPDRTTVRVNDTVRYTYMVANTGRTPLLVVTVVDDQRGSIPLGQTTLAPGVGSSGTTTAAARADESGTVAVTIAVGTAVTADNQRVGVRARAEVTVLPAAPVPPPRRFLGVVPQPPRPPPVAPPSRSPSLTRASGPTLIPPAPTRVSPIPVSPPVPPALTRVSPIPVLPLPTRESPVPVSPTPVSPLPTRVSPLPVPPALTRVSPIPVSPLPTPVSPIPVSPAVVLSTARRMTRSPTTLPPPAARRMTRMPRPPMTVRRMTRSGTPATASAIRPLTAVPPGSTTQVSTAPGSTARSRAWVTATPTVRCSPTLRWLTPA